MDEEVGMQRDKLEPTRYEYLNQELSDLYDNVVIYNEEYLRAIVRELIEAIAQGNREAHENQSN